MIYTLWISRCIATARERIPGSIDNYVIDNYVIDNYVIENDVTGVSECSQQRSNLKDNGYSVPYTIASKHTANAILRQAGIKEKI